MKDIFLDIAICVGSIALVASCIGSFYTVSDKVCINGKLYEKTDTMYIALAKECLLIKKDQIMDKAEIKRLLEEFSQVKNKEYGSFAYSSGYFEIMLGNALELLSKAQRKGMLDQIAQSTYESKAKEIVQSTEYAQ